MGGKRPAVETGLEMELGVGFSKFEHQKAGSLPYVSVRACVRVWMDGPQKPVRIGQIEDGSGEPLRVVLVARVRPRQIPAALPAKSSLETRSNTRTLQLSGSSCCRRLVTLPISCRGCGSER